MISFISFLFGIVSNAAYILCEPPIYFTQDNVNIIIPEYSSVIMPCQTNVHGALETWFKDGEVIYSNLTMSFRIKSVKRDMAGVYHCHSITDDGGIRSKRIRLMVGFLDPIIFKNASMTVVELKAGKAGIIWLKRTSQLYQDRGKAHTIKQNHNQHQGNLGINAVPSPQITWTMNNRPISSSRFIFISMVEHLLVLLNVNHEMHSKVFKARLNNGYGNLKGIYSQAFVTQVEDTITAQDNKSLHLVLPPKDVTLVLRRGYPGVANFECVFNARPPIELRLQWYRKIGISGEEGTFERIEPTSLLKHKRTDNSKEYIYSIGQFNRSLTVSNIRVDTQFGQKSGFREEYICQGSLNNHDADPSLIPSAIEEYELKSNSNVRSSTDQRLWSQGKRVSATARLMFLLEPKLVYPPEAVSVPTPNSLDRSLKAALMQTAVGSNLTIPCTVKHDGHPKAQIEWLKNANAIPSSSTRFEIGEDNGLVITNVNFSDAGVYQCYAHNSVGEDFLNYWVNVSSFGPQLMPDKATHQVMDAPEYSNVTFECPFFAAPPPVVTWRKVIDNGDDVRLDQSMPATGQLPFVDSKRASTFAGYRLASVEYKDSGLYRCRAENVLGAKTADIRLHVIARTKPGSHMPREITALEGDSLKLPCLVTAHSEYPVQVRWLHGRQRDMRTVIDEKSDNAVQTISTYEIEDRATWMKDEEIQSHGNTTGRKLKNYGSILRKQKVNWADTGVYVCQIQSAGGNLTLISELKVVKYPDRPENISASCQPTLLKNSSNSQNRTVDPRERDQCATVELTFDIAIKQTIDFVQIYSSSYNSLKYQKGCQQIPKVEWHLQSLALLGLGKREEQEKAKRSVLVNGSFFQSETAYCFKVIFVNKLGWSSDSAATTSTLDIPMQVPDKEKPLQLAHYYRDGTVIVTWIHSSEINPSVTYYQLQYQKHDSASGNKTVSVNPVNGLNRYYADHLEEESTYELMLFRCNSIGCEPKGHHMTVYSRKQRPRITPKYLLVRSIGATHAEVVIPIDVNFVGSFDGILASLKCNDPPGCTSKQHFVHNTCRRLDAPNTQNLYLNHNTSSRSYQPEVILNITGLESSSLYDLRVAFLSAAGPGPLSAVPEVFRTADKDPPLHLSALTVTWSRGKRLLTVTWQVDNSQSGDISSHSITCLKFVSFQQANGLENSTAGCASQEVKTQLLQPYHQSVSLEKMGFNLHTVKVANLCPDHFYRVTVVAVDQAGRQGVPVTTITYLGQWMKSSANGNSLSWWNSFDPKQQDRKSNLIHLHGVYLRFASIPNVIVDESFTVHLSVKLWIVQLSAEHQTMDKSISSENIISLLRLQHWPIEGQRIPDLHVSVKSEYNATIPLEWRLVSLATCESISFVTTNSFTLAGQRYHRHLLSVETAVAQVKAFSTYRLRIWSPMNTIFTGDGLNASLNGGQIVHCSLPSAWFKTRSTPPQSAPSSLRVFILDGRRIRLMWQPLNTLAFGGTTGGYLVSVDRLEDAEYKENQGVSLSNAQFTTLAYSNGLQYSQNHTRIGSCGVESMSHQIDDLSARSYTVEGLQPGASYTVKIRAFTWADEESSATKRPKRMPGGSQHSRSMLLGPENYAGPPTATEEYPCQPEWQSIPQVRMENTYAIDRLSSATAVIVNDSLLVKWSEFAEVPRCNREQAVYQVTITLWFLSVEHDGQIYEKMAEGRILSNDTVMMSSTVHKTDHGSTVADDQVHFAWRLSLTLVYDILLKSKQNDLYCHQPRLTSLEVVRFSGQGLEGSSSSSSIVLEPILLGTYLYVLNMNSLQFVPTTNRSHFQRARLHLVWKRTDRFYDQLTQSKLHWHRIDPVTDEAIGKPLVRPLVWPFKVYGLGDVSTKIIVDELTLGGTYQFHISTEGNRIKCPGRRKPTESPKLRVAVIPQEFIKQPRKRLEAPVQLIGRCEYLGGGDQAQPVYSCGSAFLLLVWPPIPSSLIDYWRTGNEIHPIHSSPIHNYSLHYALYQETRKRQLLHQWMDYKTPAYPGDENGFLVHGLLHNRGYVFRIAAWTALGRTPYSPTSRVMFTDPSRPCEAPRDFAFTTTLVNKGKSDTREPSARLHETESPQSKKEPSSLYQIFVLHWTGIFESSWNSNAERFYRISYRSRLEAGNLSSEESIFVRVSSGEGKTSTHQSGLRPKHSFELGSLFAKSTYYQVGIRAVTAHGIGPLCETELLVYSGLACEPTDRKRLTSPNSVDVSSQRYTTDKREWETPSCLVPNRLNCKNNPFIGATCSWDQVTCLQPMGYKVTLTDFGSVDSLSLNVTKALQSHSLCVPWNVTSIEFGPNTELLKSLMELVDNDKGMEEGEVESQLYVVEENTSRQKQQRQQFYPENLNNPFDLEQQSEEIVVENAASFGLHAHNIYAVSVETLLPGAAAVYHQLRTEKEKDLLLMANTKSMTTTTTTITRPCDRVGSLVIRSTGTVGTGYISSQALCTDQLPPSRPHRLHTHWVTRHQVQLSWLPPRQRNGRLTAYRVLVLTVGQGNADRNLTSNQSVAGQEKIISLPADATATSLGLAVNATYWIEVTARTGSSLLLNGGWSRPSCILLALDACALTDSQEVRVPRDHCLSRNQVFQVMQRKKTLGNCESLPDAEVYRPLIELIEVNPEIRLLSGQKQIVSTAQTRHKASQMKAWQPNLSISWKPTPHPQHKVSQFLLELRTSRNLEVWYPLAAVEGTRRGFNCSTDIVQSNQVSSGARAVHPELVQSGQQDSALTAAFVDSGVSPASMHHLAVQIRVVPVHRNHIGWPSDASPWLILPVADDEHATSSRNIWLHLVAALFLVFAIGCVACALAMRIRSTHMSKRLHASQTMTHQRVVFECCRSKSAYPPARQKEGCIPGADLFPRLQRYISSGELGDEQQMNSYHLDPSMTICSDANLRHSREGKSITYDRPNSRYGDYCARNPSCNDRLISSALETGNQVEPFYEPREQTLLSHASRTFDQWQLSQALGYPQYPPRRTPGVATLNSLPVTTCSYSNGKSPFNMDMLSDVLGSNLSSLQRTPFRSGASQETITNQYKVCNTLSCEPSQYIQGNVSGLGDVSGQLIKNDHHANKTTKDWQMYSLNNPLPFVNNATSLDQCASSGNVFSTPEFRRSYLKSLTDNSKSVCSANNKWKHGDGMCYYLDGEEGANQAGQLYLSNNLKSRVNHNHSFHSQRDWSQANEKSPVLHADLVSGSLQVTSLQNDFHFTTPSPLPMTPGYYEFYQSETPDDCNNFAATDV